MADYPHSPGPITKVLLDNDFIFDSICHKCGYKPTFIKIVNGRTVTIKVKGLLRNDITGQVFDEQSATIVIPGLPMSVISLPEYTQSVLNAQGFAKETTA